MPWNNVVILSGLLTMSNAKWTTTKSKRNKKDNTEKGKGLVIVPYVERLTETVTHIFRRHGIATAVRPHSTLRKILVHPKDKMARCVRQIAFMKSPVLIMSAHMLVKQVASMKQD